MDRPATTTEQQFLDHIARRVSEGERPNIRQAEWLIARAERLETIERALRGDPGHDVTAAVVSPMEDRTKSISLWERMGRALLASTGPFDEAVCRVCGSSDGCEWVEGTNRTLCNALPCIEAALASGMVHRTEEPEPVDPVERLREAARALAERTREYVRLPDGAVDPRMECDIELDHLATSVFAALGEQPEAR